MLDPTRRPVPTAPTGSAALGEEWKRVDPPSRPVLLINPRSGGGKAARAGLAERARERGIKPFVLGPKDDLAALIAEALDGGAGALGMAGGDGSLATVAAAAVQHDLPFICVPAGTRNHFALDVGIDRHDLIGALDAFTTGVERRIDMGEVNGRPFLNNVSLGLYGDAVRQPGYRDAKVRTILETIAGVMTEAAPPPPLLVTDNLGKKHTEPVVVLVSNNEYALHEPLARGSRPRLDAGQLGVVVVDRPGTARLPIRSWSTSSVEVMASAPVPAGIDGESVTLPPPLRYSTRPGTLRVRISSRHPGASPAALLRVGRRP